jgi:hypothetical protein
VVELQKRLSAIGLISDGHAKALGGSVPGLRDVRSQQKPETSRPGGETSSSLPGLLHEDQRQAIQVRLAGKTRQERVMPDVTSPTPPEPEASPVECSRPGCHNPGTLKPVLLFRLRKRGDSSSAVLNEPICDHCALQSIPSDFLPDATWNKCVALFLANGKRVPKRRYTTIEFVPITYIPGTAIRPGGSVGIGT